MSSKLILKSINLVENDDTSTSHSHPNKRLRKKSKLKKTKGAKNTDSKEKTFQANIKYIQDEMQRMENMGDRMKSCHDQLIEEKHTRSYKKKIKRLQDNETDNPIHVIKKPVIFRRKR